jgi:hypothetical protein
MAINIENQDMLALLEEKGNRAREILAESKALRAEERTLIVDLYAAGVKRGDIVSRTSYTVGQVGRFIIEGHLGEDGKPINEPLDPTVRKAVREAQRAERAAEIQAERAGKLAARQAERLAKAEQAMAAKAAKAQEAVADAAAAVAALEEAKAATAAKASTTDQADDATSTTTEDAKPVKRARGRSKMVDA